MRTFRVFGIVVVLVMGRNFVVVWKAENASHPKEDHSHLAVWLLETLCNQLQKSDTRTANKRKSIWVKKSEEHCSGNKSPK
jgi:hypothetical protein